MKLAILLLFLTTFASAQQPAGTTHPAHISGGVMAGQILTKVTPVYPPEAKAQRISGMVVLRAVIARDGTIQNLTVVSGPDLLAQSAITAVSQWTYKPYLLNGEPTEVDTTITVNFSMGDDPPPADPSSADPGPPVRVSGGTMSGQRLTKVAPIYPQEAKDQHLSGKVVFHAIIGRDGNIQSLKLISGDDLFARAAWQAVKQWTYKPYTLNGVPTEVDTTITVNFNMGG